MLNVIAFCISTEQWGFCDGCKKVGKGHRSTRGPSCSWPWGAESHQFCVERAQTRMRGRRWRVLHDRDHGCCSDMLSLANLVQRH